MSLKILHVIGSVDPASGGPIEGVRQLSRVNASFGHQIELLTLDNPASKWVGEFAYPVHAAGPSYTHYGYTPRLVPWLKANVHRYDCVIINGIWGYNCFGAWQALRNSDVPYYVYTHGMLDPWFKYRYPLKHLKKWLFWPWAVYPALRDATGVFFTCEEERMLARDSFWLYDCNEIVVSYGTPGAPDSSRNYAPDFLEKHPALQGVRRFVFLGRVHPKKGPDILIRTIAHLRNSGHWNPETMKVIMAGPSDGCYAAKLQALSRRLGVESSVYWTGMLMGDDKWGALQCAEAFVLPSHQENFGIAVAEALSLGVPVLISKPVNIWADIIADGAGFAADDDLNGCVELFERWFALNETQKVEMGRKAKECFNHRYTAKRAAVSLVSNIYQTMIIGGGGGGTAQLKAVSR